MKLKNILITEVSDTNKIFNYSQYKMTNDNSSINYSTLKELLRDTNMEISVSSLNIFELELLINISQLIDPASGNGRTLFTEQPFDDRFTFRGDVAIEYLTNITRVYIKFGKMNDIVTEYKKFLDLDIVIAIMNEATFNFINDDIVWRNIKWVNNTSDFNKIALLSSNLLKYSDRITLNDGTRLSDRMGDEGNKLSSLVDMSASLVIELFKFKWTIDYLDGDDETLEDMPVNDDSPRMNYLTPATVMACLENKYYDFNLKLTEYQLLYLSSVAYIYGHKIITKGERQHFDTPSVLKGKTEQGLIKDYSNQKNTTSFFTHIGKVDSSTSMIVDRESSRCIAYKYDIRVTVNHLYLFDFIRFVLSERNDVFESSAFRRMILKELNSSKALNTLTNYFSRKPIDWRIVTNKEKIDGSRINGLKLIDIINPETNTHKVRLTPSLLRKSFDVMCTDFKYDRVFNYDNSLQCEKLLIKKYVKHRSEDLQILKKLINKYGATKLIEFIPVDMTIIF